MESQSFSNPVGWSFVLIGLVLAFISALTPHFHTGYFLMISVLLAGLSPYLVYAVAVPLLRGPVTTWVGFLLVMAHIGLVIAERFIGGADYSDGLIYTLPLVLAITLLPLAVFALFKTD